MFHSYDKISLCRSSEKVGRKAENTNLELGLDSRSNGRPGPQDDPNCGSYHDLSTNNYWIKTKIQCGIVQRKQTGTSANGCYVFLGSRTVPLGS